MELFEQGRKAFNQERFFEAHELWEELWTPLTGLERRRLQGLIHFAVGLYHHGRGNRVGAMRQLRKGLEKTADCGAGWRGLDVARVRAEIVAALRAVERGEPVRAIRL